MKYLETSAIPPCSGTTPRPQLSRQMARTRRHRELPSPTPLPRLSRRMTHSLSSSTRFAPAPDSAEPPCGAPSLSSSTSVANGPTPWPRLSLSRRMARSPSSSTRVAAAPALDEPPDGTRSPSSVSPAPPAPASAEPPDGARSQSSNSVSPVPPAPASAEPSALAVVPVACLGGVSSRPDGWAHPGGRWRKMCCGAAGAGAGAAWPAGRAGGSHRIAKCNAKGWERVTARNHISRQSIIVQKSVQWAPWPGPAQSAAGDSVSNGGRPPVGGRFRQPDRTPFFRLTPALDLH